MGSIIFAAINTGIIYFYDSKIHFSATTKVDIIFYTIIFISILSLFEVIKSNQLLKDMEVEKAYNDGQIQGRRDQAFKDGTKPDVGED